MSTLGVSSMKRHGEYYLRDGNICFLVEGTMFRLHRHFFERESQYFRDRLSPSTEGEDGSPDSPYIIHDVKIDEFAQFIWVWYNPYYSYARKGKDQWLTILKLATQWEFHEVRNLAIRQLERLDLEAVEKIAIYKRYRIAPQLLLPSYMLLCRRGGLPSPEEGKILSMETVLRLASARERMILSALESGCKTPTTATAPDDVAKAIIAKEFELAIYSNDEPAKVEGQAMVNGSASGDIADTEVVTVKQPKKGKSQFQELFQNINGAGGTSTNKTKTNK